jgi:hypothetical protein
MPAQATSAAGIANPASVYCNDNGGKLEIRTGPGGGQIGVCIFPDGSECEEWAYFRGECQPGTTPAAPVPATGAIAEPVMLQVLLPEDGSVSELGECQVVGSTSPGAVVSVNDQILVAGSDGTFQTTVTLEEGVNLIEAVASNSSGGEAYVSRGDLRRERSDLRQMLAHAGNTGTFGSVQAALWLRIRLRPPFTALRSSSQGDKEKGRSDETDSAGALVAMAASLVMLTTRKGGGCAAPGRPGAEPGADASRTLP